MVVFPNFSPVNDNLTLREGKTYSTYYISETNVHKNTIMFAHLTLRMSARRCTIMFAKQSTETIVIKPKEMSKSPMKKMFALIKMFQSAINIGSVTIQIHPCQIVTTKSGLTIR